MKPRTTCERCGRRGRLIGYRTLCRTCRLAAYVAGNRRAAATVRRRKLTRELLADSATYYAEAAE